MQHEVWSGEHVVAWSVECEVWSVKCEVRRVKVECEV